VTETVRIEPLSGDHDRSQFLSGSDALDRYFRGLAFAGLESFDRMAINSVSKSGSLESTDMGDIFFQSLIDLPLWDSALWKGTAFLHDLDGVEAPGIGFFFDDINAGRKIFLGWHERVGKIDQYEEIRISIIRGEILGLPSGYSVHVSSNPLHTVRRAEDQGLVLDFQTAVGLESPPSNDPGSRVAAPGAV
jgi:hypothetical protein